MEEKKIKTAEYARKGHPDRVCDIISDALVDEFLKQDPLSRVAVDVIGGHNVVYVIGEISTIGYVDIPKIVRETYKEIGYQDSIGVIVNVVEQSPEIRDLANIGAGDSGIMVGYATKETSEMLPAEVVLAKRIVDILDKLPYLLPDGKVQVTTEDDQATKIVIAYQAEENFDEEVREAIMEVNWDQIDLKCEWKMIQFKKGGFDADSGLTGRKNVLWYGPQVPTGGGAFAGKDATKVDRSAAYLARNLAIKYLKEENLKECIVKLAYVIGQPLPVMATVNGRDISVTTSVKDAIEAFGLRKPIYKQASILGHFGNPVLPWEKYGEN